MIRGKVVLVPFPFDDLSDSKARPAVCLTDPIGPHAHIILAFISSKIPATHLETDILVNQKTDKEAMGLRVNSIIRLHRMVTVSTNIIRRELGSTPPEIQDEIIAELRTLFQL